MGTVKSGRGAETGGWIFNIQRYSIHDGPGIRTIVFFKGCPLRCLWCDNPESQERAPSLLYFRSLCRKCLRCIEACHANILDPQGVSIQVDRNACQSCENPLCLEVCSAGCRSISGRFTTVDEILGILQKDTLFYRNSGGGVTLSGGEPTYQPRFAYELLRRSAEAGFHNCLQTCGYVRPQVLKKILTQVDLVLFDIKHTDPVIHKLLTGVSNQIILDNLKMVASTGIPLVIRAPFIPPYNNAKKDIKALGKLAVQLRIKKVELIPFHQLGRNKYAAMDKDYRLAENPPVTRENLLDAEVTLESYGLDATII